MLFDQHEIIFCNRAIWNPTEAGEKLEKKKRAKANLEECAIEKKSVDTLQVSGIKENVTG